METPFYNEANGYGLFFFFFKKKKVYFTSSHSQGYFAWKSLYLFQMPMREFEYGGLCDLHGVCSIVSVDP
jgi:hypothetical protein